MRLRPVLLAFLAAALVFAFAGVAAAQVTLNELRIDQPGTDTDEYFELKGTPLTSLTGLWYIVIGDGAGVCGTVETVVDLTGYSIQDDGYAAFTDSDAGVDILTGYDYVLPGNALNFENSDNVTHLVVSAFTGAINDDLDTNDDGVLDVTPWTTVVDGVALSEGTVPNCLTDEYYYTPGGISVVGPDGINVPGHVWRCEDTSAWQIGNFDITVGVDSPGAANDNCLAGPPTVVLSSEARTPCVPDPSQSVTVDICGVDADTAWVTYHVNGGGPVNLAMSPVSTSGDTTCYQAVLPGQAVNGTLVEYLVTMGNINGTSIGHQQGYFVGLSQIGTLRVNNGSGANLYEFYGARIRGNVTAAYGSFSSLRTDGYIQDATSGINVFEFDLHPVFQTASLGDELEVEGIVDQFNGKLEITSGGPCDSLLIENLGPGAVPTPLDILPCGVNEENEGKLVKMFYAQVDTTLPNVACSYGIWCGNRNYEITNCVGDNNVLFIDLDSNIPGNPINSVQYVVTGICSQFASVNLLIGYEVIPRQLSDLAPITVTVGIGDDARQPTMRLLQNSPNPFNTRTNIRYEVPKSGAVDGKSQVSLKVYDIQGRLRATLVDGILDPGEHQISFDAARANLSTGMYFYTLDVEGQKLTQKLLIQR